MMAGFHGKGGGQRMALAIPINYMSPLRSNILNLVTFYHVFLDIMRRGGAAHRVILEENVFYLCKKYILNVLGNKNMYWVLVW